MKHLGDITKIHGCAVPITDCVIGGSPCQDLSVAGKRAGLAGARSGLFMKQIRIVKEMRYADQCSGRTGQFIRPRHMVWENVPGAFSSNKGEDFRAVLEEVIRIAEPSAPDIPLPDKGKWPLADCWYGDGWSVAYRVLDAQFWGVPQRRRRIALVADFGGQSAPEILFERQGLRGDITPSGKARKEVAGDIGESVEGGNIKCLTPWLSQTSRIYDADGVWPCLSANEGGGQNRAAVCYGVDGYNQTMEPELVQTIRANKSDADHVGAVCYGVDGYNHTVTGDIAVTLTAGSGVSATHSGPMVAVAYGIGGYHSEGMKSDNPHSGIYIAETARTLDCNGGNPACNQGGIAVVHPQVVGTLAASGAGTDRPAGQGNETDFCIACSQQRSDEYMQSDISSSLKQRDYKDATDLIVNLWHWTVRRLTPLECERLQGFPDGWTDIGPWTDSAGKLHKESSDSARYKALGNSIALPPWKWVLKRLCAFYERDATMASLFDGIGGFPLIWEQLNGKGSCLWASEIEEFPIAVTKRHFSELEATP